MKDKINELLKAVGLKATEIKLETVTVDNGAATLEAEMFEAGQAVFIVNADERIPLPVGEYLLDDGRTLVVTEEGMISEMREAGAEEEAEVEEDVAMEEGATEQAPLPKSIIESVVKETKFSKEDIEALVEAKLTELGLIKNEEEKEEVTEETTEETVDPVEMNATETVDEEVKPIQHNPENVAPKAEGFKYGSNKGGTTLDKVFARLSK